jgi:hypothetical protein
MTLEVIAGQPYGVDGNPVVSAAGTGHHQRLAVNELVPTIGLRRHPIVKFAD